MSRTMKTRVYLTGVGGQGTLTATKILAQAALDQGLAVTAGEIHGMAQRGGVVESFVLIGGYRAPMVSPGEADVLLGFEPLETYRAVSALGRDAAVVSSSEFIAPIGVNLGRDELPPLDDIEARAAECAATARFLPALSLGRKAGAVQSANMVLLGALCSLELVPFGLDELAETIKANLKPKLVDMNLTAIELGAEAAGTR